MTNAERNALWIEIAVSLVTGSFHFVNLLPSGQPSFEPDVDFGRDPFYEREFSYNFTPRVRFDLAPLPHHNDDEAP